MKYEDVKLLYPGVSLMNTISSAVIRYAGMRADGMVMGRPSVMDRWDYVNMEYVRGQCRDVTYPSDEVEPCGRIIFTDHKGRKANEVINLSRLSFMEGERKVIGRIVSVSADDVPEPVRFMIVDDEGEPVAGVYASDKFYQDHNLRTIRLEHDSKQKKAERKKKEKISKSRNGRPVSVKFLKDTLSKNCRCVYAGRGLAQDRKTKQLIDRSYAEYAGKSYEDAAEAYRINEAYLIAQYIDCIESIARNKDAEKRLAAFLELHPESRSAREHLDQIRVEQRNLLKRSEKLDMAFNEFCRKKAGT